MRILLTGGSGFLGKAILANAGQEEVITLGRTESTINADLTQKLPNLSGYELVIHSAGKAHSVPRTEQEKFDFYTVNVEGTKNLLKSLEVGSRPRKFIFISSVSVYGLSTGEFVDESYPLLATDPYGGSKIAAEKLIIDWCSSQNVNCLILRLPLIAGPNPPGNLQSMLRGIQKGYYFNIAGGKARKSMVLAEDVGKLVLSSGDIGGVYNLTDGYHPSFSELSALIADQLGEGKPASIPFWLANLMAGFGDLYGSKGPFNTDKLRKITNDLTFDDSNARIALGWNPTPVLEGFRIL